MKDFERDDPMEFVAISYPVRSNEVADRELARCLVEEYALSGFTANEVAELFESPIYTAPYRIYRRRGHAFVQETIEGVYGARP